MTKQDRKRKQVRESMARMRERRRLAGIDQDDSPASYHATKVCVQCKGRLEACKWRVCLACAPHRTVEFDDEFLFCA